MILPKMGFNIMLVGDKAFGKRLFLFQMDFILGF